VTDELNFAARREKLEALEAAGCLYAYGFDRRYSASDAILLGAAEEGPGKSRGQDRRRSHERRRSRTFRFDRKDPAYFKKDLIGEEMYRCSLTSTSARGVTALFGRAPVK
jgi:hypothetical protein